MSSLCATGVHVNGMVSKVASASTVSTAMASNAASSVGVRAWWGRVVCFYSSRGGLAGVAGDSGYEWYV